MPWKSARVKLVSTRQNPTFLGMGVFWITIGGQTKWRWNQDEKLYRKMKKLFQDNEDLSYRKF